MRTAILIWLTTLPLGIAAQPAASIVLADSNQWRNINLSRAGVWVFRHTLESDPVPASPRALDSLRNRPDWTGYGWFDGIVPVDSIVAARPWILSYYGPWAVRIWVNGHLTLRTGTPSPTPESEILPRYLNPTQRAIRLSEGDNHVRIEYSEHTVPWRFAANLPNVNYQVISLFLIRPGEGFERRYRAFVFGGCMLLLVTLFLLHGFLAYQFRNEYHQSVMLTIGAIGLHAFATMSDSLVNWTFAYAPFNEIVYATVFIFVIYYFTIALRLQLQLPVRRNLFLGLLIAAVALALASALNGRAYLHILHPFLAFGLLGYVLWSIWTAKRSNPDTEVGILVGGFIATIAGAMLYAIPYLALGMTNTRLLSISSLLAYSSIPIALTLNIARNYSSLYRTMEQKVAERTAQLQKADEYKSRFFANISHEFRTPLTIARGLLNRYVMRRGDNPELLSELGPVQRNLSRLGDMVNQIVDLTKSDYDQMALNRKLYRADSIVTLSVESFRSLAEHRRQQLVHLPGAGEAVLYADRLKLEIMINNLVSNAIKFTPESGVIRVSTAAADGTFRLRVTDTGRGIPESEREAIFERFHRIKQNDSEYVEGMGIGLELSRTLARLHGGDITLMETEPDKGSTFELTLPTSADGNAEDVMQDFNDFPGIAPRAPQPASDRILLVEDNDDMAAYISDVLQDAGVVVRATNGEDALAILDHTRPDLIITDLMMPKMGGAALVEKLRHRDEWHDTPVVVLTAMALESGKLDLLSIGVVDYITKPFSANELLFKSRTLLKLAKNRRKARIVLNAEEPSLDRERITPKAAEWVKGHIRDQSLSVDVLADHLNMSRRTLYRIIEAETGMTSAEFIREIRLQTARSLLQNSNQATLDAVAEAVGYASGRNFRKLYHERFGVHPLDELKSGG